MSLAEKTIAVIGAGNMGEALIRGLLAAKAVAPDRIIASDVRAERLEFFRKTFSIRTTVDNAAAVAAADIVVLAVKPQQMSAVLAGVRARLTPQRLVISIAAGVPTARIARELGEGTRVVRVMPNTPALIGAGMAALCRGADATEADLATAETILGTVGVTVRTDEQHLDAITALSGSGPAYVFLVAEAMIKAGQEAGLSAEVAGKLVKQTVLGAAKMMVETGDSPEQLREKVTSKGGTTAAALKVMADRQLTAIFAEAIQAATRRSRELAGA